MTQRQSMLKVTSLDEPGGDADQMARNVCAGLLSTPKDLSP